MAETITGLDVVRQSIAGTKADMRDKFARRIVVAGLSIPKKESKAIVTRKGLIKSRALINNIAIKRQRNAGPGIEQYHLGVRHGPDLGKKAIKYYAMGKSGRIVIKRANDPFYWRFLELGHKIVQRNTDPRQRRSITERRVYFTGRVEPVPFIAPALETKQREVIDAMGKQAAKLLALSK